MSTDPASRMHEADPAMVRTILDYVADRLLESEVPLDGLADRAHLDEVLVGRFHFDEATLFQLQPVAFMQHDGLD